MKNKLRIGLSLVVLSIVVCEGEIAAAALVPPRPAVAAPALAAALRPLNPYAVVAPAPNAGQVLPGVNPLNFTDGMSARQTLGTGLFGPGELGRLRLREYTFGPTGERNMSYRLSYPDETIEEAGRELVAFLGNTALTGWQLMTTAAQLAGALVLTVVAPLGLACGSGAAVRQLLRTSWTSVGYGTRSALSCVCAAVGNLVGAAVKAGTAAVGCIFNKIN
ncbi:MAG: hypothetical protein LBB25_01360 [Holosporaceae bacterium]|nr:hypothetical protein [Holosporaceae bacterium]